MIDKEKLILEIMKKTGLSEKVLWNMIKNKKAKGVSEDGAVKMIASEKGIFWHKPAKTDLKIKKKQNKTKHVQKNISLRKKYELYDIGQLQEGDRAVVRAAIVQVFESKNMFFYACPVCGKSVKEDSCAEHSTEIPQMAMILSCVLDDGTGNIRAVLFSRALQNLIGMSIDDAKAMFDKNGIADVLNNVSVGKDYVFMGNVKLNSFFSKKELAVSNVKNVSVLEEINRLEKIIRSG